MNSSQKAKTNMNWTRTIPTNANKHQVSLTALASKEHAHPDVLKEMKRRAKRNKKV